MSFLLELFHPRSSGRRNDRKSDRISYWVVGIGALGSSGVVLVSVKTINRGKGLVRHSFVELRFVQRDQEDHGDSINRLWTTIKHYVMA